MKILIVDDEMDLRESLSDLIQLELDCVVDLCGNGEEAQVLCNENQYDLIILDYRMPKMTGTELYKSLLKTGNSNRLAAIIFLSGFIDEVESQVSQDKNLYFKSKPVKPIEFLNFVSQICHQMAA